MTLLIKLSKPAGAGGGSRIVPLGPGLSPPETSIPAHKGRGGGGGGGGGRQAVLKASKDDDASSKQYSIALRERASPWNA